MTDAEKVAQYNGVIIGILSALKISSKAIPPVIDGGDPLELTFAIERRTLYPFTSITATGYTIDWGDGTINSNMDSHYYSTLGTKTIKVTFSGLTAISFSSQIYLTKVAGQVNHCLGLTSLAYCFSSCTGLTQISSSLFDYCRNVTSAMQIFNNCKVLTTIPLGLFDKLFKCTTFEAAFSNCIKLITIREWIIYDMQ